MNCDQVIFITITENQLLTGATTTRGPTNAAVSTILNSMTMVVLVFPLIRVTVNTRVVLKWVL